MNDSEKLKFSSEAFEDVNLLSPLVLAYIGDAVYELVVRRFLVAKGIAKADNLHKKAVEFVRAKAQAKVMLALQEHLKDEELRIVRRGRNAKSRTPKECKISDYRFSTAFEALIGYLYLKGDVDRLNYILQLIHEVKSEEC
ncbi:Mini-ribonuclease 3 [Peptococcaceae bacterium]|nr:Mini-ribonuclease 3 [Peptococcaceae bacterium]MCL0106122.1 Mini-ribonuclease 3 [Peptococcaceae bacterium]